MFDSGLGGLTVLSAVRWSIDATDVVYFADTAHVPYGDRTLEEVSGFARRIIAYLMEREPAMIAIACGTTCSAFDKLGWPDIGVPLLGLVGPGARSAVEATRSGAIGVVATNATAKSGVFDRAIRAERADAVVTSIGAPALVPIVERGDWATDDASAAVATCCEPFVRASCDTVVLGCTHFPHLTKWFREALGPGVRIIDPGEAVGRDAAKILSELEPQSGAIDFEVSGDPVAFAKSASILLRAEVNAKGRDLS
ncbi:MAG TPA: glutamate racemase [Candidatus Eremiobacteraceae bacterium]